MNFTRNSRRVRPTIYRLPSTPYRLLLASVLLLTTLHTAAAQRPDPVDVLRIDTDLVTLSVSVFNRTASRSSINLQQKDFSVLDDGAPQEIAFFESRESPFDLVLLLDLSGSTADKLGLIRKSAKRFVDAARPEDRIAIFIPAALALTCQSSCEPGMASRCPKRASTAAADFGPQPGRPG